MKIIKPLKGCAMVTDDNDCDDMCPPHIRPQTCTLTHTHTCTHTAWFTYIVVLKTNNIAWNCAEDGNIVY